MCRICHKTDSHFYFQSNNATIQKKYKAEVSDLHDALLQVKRDYDMLRMEFEQNIKANEQTGERRVFFRDKGVASIL